MKGKNGEHPFGDIGQLILLGLFLVVWVGDSFFLRISTFPSDYVPMYMRLIILARVSYLHAPDFRKCLHVNWLCTCNPMP